MTMDNEHPTESLQELLDERLAADERAAIERHAAECDRCRRELEVLRWTRRTLRGATSVEPAPPALEGQILAALDQEQETARPARASRPVWHRALAAAAVLAILGAGLFLSRPSPDVPALLARDFVDYQAGRLPLEHTADEVASIEGFFSGRGLGFETRVLDLAMMEFGPVGGRVHSVAGTTSALFVYVGPDGQTLICQMYPGRVTDLPEPVERRLNEGIGFQVYERDGKTIVAWQEGLVVCVLVSDMPREEVVQLAFGKAMKV